MNQQSSKTPFYTRRSSAEKMGVTFDFLKGNWKVVLKYATCLILPVCVVQALFMDTIAGGMVEMQNMQKAGETVLESFGAGMIASFIVIILCSLFASVLLTSLLYALMQTYHGREEGLKGITISGLKDKIIRNVKRSLRVILFCLVLTSIAGTLLAYFNVITQLTLFLIVPLVFVCALPLALFTPYYLFENVGITKAFTKSFRLGVATWGGVFVVVLILGIIGVVLGGITSVPWYVAFVVKQLFIFNDVQSGVTVSTGYTIMLYLFTVIQLFGVCLANMFTVIGLAYQYSHAREKIDNVSVSSIDTFGQPS